MTNNEFNSVATPEISVILATKGDKLDFLEKCIDSLKKQSFQKFEIILVSKKFPEPLRNLIESAHIIFIQENGSTLGAARNLGVKNAKGILVSFIDDDAEAPSDWLSKISLTFLRFSSLSCLGGPHFTPPKESEKNRLSLVSGLFGEAHMQQVYIGKSAIGKIAGCNVTYRKSLFENVGYLNENLKTCEDWEFNRRLMEKGCTMRFDPGICVWHHRQGLKHIFQASSKSAPFYLSWKTFKLVKYDSLIASFYVTNLLFIFLFIILLVSPYTFLLLFVLFFAAYITFTAIKTKTYGRKIFYFPLAILPTIARILGFYYGIIKYVAITLQSLFSRPIS